MPLHEMYILGLDLSVKTCTVIRQGNPPASRRPGDIWWVSWEPELLSREHRSYLEGTQIFWTWQEAAHMAFKIALHRVNEAAARLADVANQLTQGEGGA